MYEYSMAEKSTAKRAATMQKDDDKSTTPPLIAFKTFLEVLNRFEQDLPDTISRGYLRNLAYSNTIASQLLQGFQFLALTEGETHKVTPQLRRLVKEKEIRKQLIGDLISKRYRPIFEDIGELSETTHREIEQAFTDHYKMDGENRRKAISFFIHAAHDGAGMPISPYIRTSVNTNSTQAAPRKSGSRPIDSNNHRASESPPAIPDEQLYHQSTQIVKALAYSKGETLTLTYSGDIFKANKEERDFLFFLLDKMIDFEQRATNAGNSDGKVTEKEES